MTTSNARPGPAIETEDAGNQHGFRCLTCGCSHKLAIRAHIWTAISMDGSDPYGQTPSDEHYWQDNDDAACMSCGWRGKVSALRPSVAGTAYALIFHGREGTHTVQIFSTRAEAIASRHDFVQDHWDLWVGDDPIPDDPDEAFDRFNDEASPEGWFISLMEVPVEA
jgi:hypothetical protein